MWTSVPQIEATLIRIRTSSGPGSGFGTCFTTVLFGAGFSFTAAFILSAMAGLPFVYVRGWAGGISRLYQCFCVLRDGDQARPRDSHLPRGDDHALRRDLDAPVHPPPRDVLRGLPPDRLLHGGLLLPEGVAERGAGEDRLQVRLRAPRPPRARDAGLVRLREAYPSEQRRKLAGSA